MFEFEIEGRDPQSGARAGRFRTDHGDILTPIFAPVGTQATVKAMTPRDMSDIGVSLLLGNTYHLYLRPGDRIIKDMGGLHRFMGWHGPILTDSGGFQVFSLSDCRKIDQDGVTFKSHLDGSTHRFTPETSIAIQENLGADIIMTFDECPPPDDYDYVKESLSRTHTWAERCLKAHRNDKQALFGIVQGGIFADLREESARFLMDLDFPGFGIGGLSVGEEKADMYAMVELLNTVLPQDKPRYLMGVGEAEDIVHGVMRGVDMFDCVLPTRLARHGSAMVQGGRLNLNNASFTSDPRPIEEGCVCYTCQNFSRSYIRHLVKSKEILSHILLTTHNIHFLLDLVRRLREAIIEGSFLETARRQLADNPVI